MANYNKACTARQAPVNEPRLDRMRRRCAAIAALLLGIAILAPESQALALGIGEQSALSRLFQPLQIEVPLELDGLPPEDVRVTLGLEAIEASGASRAISGLGLQREIVVDEAGRALLRVTSPELVREPVLLLHVDLSGSGIHVQRDLTLLFDPASPAPVRKAPAAVPALKPAESNGGDEAARRALLREAERVSDYREPEKKRISAKPAAAVRSASRLVSGPAANSPGALRLEHRFSPRAAKLASPSSSVVLPPVTLRAADGLTPASQELLRAAQARPVAAAPPAAASPLTQPASTVPEAPPTAAAPARNEVVVADAPAAVAPAEVSATPATAAVVPAAVEAPPAPPPPSAPGSVTAPPMGLLLGLLGAGALTFGWLFRTVRATDNQRALPEPASLDHGFAVRRVPEPVELRITPLELGRTGSPSPSPRPAVTRSVPPPMESEIVSPRPEPPSVAEESVAKPVPKAIENWSPDDFDLLTPIDDKRPGRR